MSAVPEVIVELQERFAHNLDQYRRPEYRETQVRREFIDPLFTALGWDVANKRGVSPRYQEVLLEPSLAGRGSVRSPDYCFRVGETPKFFVEAKKPAVDIYYDIHPAYQLRSYAWTSELPLSILTDFEEFSVYDCRIRPKPADKAAAARIMYLRYDEYIDRWDEIAGVFSRDAVWRSDFDRYAEATRGKRGTQRVDDAFLEEIETWRALLARNIALRNHDLTKHELNFAVQRIIDRIIFLRISEDRGIEPFEQLKDTLTPRGDAYPRLVGLFRRADDRYNSGLFHFREERGRTEPPDTLTPVLRVDDKVLARIINGLYFPRSPYRFSVLGAHILGSVYERFLGSVIELTPAHRAKVQQKPEVRKAGGVYYTPKYIVDYIVKNTVGILCEGKTPGQIGKLHILDPACGSGSFLLGAYQYLLDYHRDWYVEHPTKQPRREIYQGKGGDWFLTTEEKKRILLNNIYGVDIDPQAVEVTKLSLLLKVLEGESEETIAQQMQFWQERVLPDLSDNIKCGNSLIGPDYWEGKQTVMFDEEEIRRVNAFDWEKQFAEIIAGGGFDAVIGNPPYNAALTPEERHYLRQTYESVSAGRQDTAAVFVQEGLQLCKGTVMYLLPYRLISRKRNHGPFQRWLHGASHIRKVIYLGKLAEIGSNDEFMILQVKSARTTSRLVMLVAPRASRCDLEKLEVQFDELQQRRWGPPDYHMNIRLGQFNQDLLAKVEGVSLRLGDIAECRDGIVPFIRDKLVTNCKKDESFKPLLGIRGFYSLGRYSLSWGGTYICYDIEEAKKYIKDRKELRKVQLRDERIFLRPEKILTAQDSVMIKGMLDTQRFYTTNSIHTTYLKDDIEGYNTRYVLGLMNSRLLNYYHQSLVLKGQDLHPQILVTNLRKLPIRCVNFSDPADKACHDRMVVLVERMLELHKRQAAARTNVDRELYARQIEATDREIDNLVYELYGLTEEEIAIVEGIVSGAA